MLVVMRPTAKSLILDLLSTLKGRSMPVRALVAAATLFGIEGNSLRVALARLLAGGTLERDERGEYRLGDRARAVQQQVVSWRRLEEQVRAWQGGWIGVCSSGLPRGSRAELRRRERALRFLGFRELENGLALRPDNLVGGLNEVVRRLVALGFPERAPVMSISALDPASEARAMSLWETDELVAEYRRSCRELEQSEKRLETLPVAQAMVESFRIGGSVIHQLVYDPLLPEPIVPVAERRQLVAAMQRYDSIGHGYWRAFFREHRVASLRAPVDAKIHEALEPRFVA